MRKRWSIFLIALFMMGFSSNTATAQDFEGIIHFELADMTQQGMGEVPYMVKGNKGRMEISHQGQKSAMIMLPDESKIVMVIEQMQGFIEMDTNEEGEQTEDIDDSDLNKTGETKTIAGRKCEVWEMNSEDGTFEVCMAKGLGTFMMPQTEMQQQQAPDWAKQFWEDGAMPLEIVEVENGNQSVKMKATKIEEKSLSDDLFEVPDDYRDMSGMMQGMQNQN
ncbi:MAG: DUF4412 domain-containing protein [Bacteroidota bacterium]